MKWLRVYEPGDEVYPLKDWADWKRDQRATVKAARWERIGDDPLQILDINVHFMDSHTKASAWSDQVEPVAICTADLAGIDKETA